MKQFSLYKEYKNFEKTGSDGRLMIENLESEGDTLEELLDNATLGVIDWNGNEAPHLTLGDLSEPDYQRVEADIKRIYKAQKQQDLTKVSYDV